MKKIIVLTFMSLLLQSCNGFLRNKRYSHKEDQRVKRCREAWKFEVIDDVLEVELLEFMPKISGTTFSHPNFFIGINSNNDTVGIIDYFSNAKFSKGDKLRFLSEENKDEISKVLASMQNKPVFYISNKKKENDLQCAVKTIYYGKVIED